MIDWTSVASNVGTFFVGAGILAFLVRAIVKQLLSKDIEKFKAELSKHAYEHQVRFERLHTKRAEVIAEIYGLLVQADWAMNNLVCPIEWAGGPSKKELYSEAQKALVSLYRFLDLHRIYFSEVQSASLTDFHDVLRKTIHKVKPYLDWDRSMNEAFREAQVKAWDNAYGTMQEHAPSLRQALEHDFRDILGLSSDATKPSATPG